jgi:hypothetical protein
MDEAHLGHKINNAKLVADLHSNGEIGACFWWKEDFDGLLLERRVTVMMIHFNDLKLIIVIIVIVIVSLNNDIFIYTCIFLITFALPLA